MIQPNAQADETYTAPYDVDRHYFAINADQGGLFSNKVSYPNGDSTDIIQLSLANVQTNRTIGIMMACSGTGIEYLRWGHSESVALGCEDTLELNFTQNTPDRQLTVMLPAVNGQQYVEYQLNAMPIAPTDEDQHVVPIDRNSGGVLQQTISYPIGDTQDTLALYAHDLQDISPNNYREIMLIMRCNGEQIEQLRWGADVANRHCGESMMVTMSYAEKVRYITVMMPQHNGNSFVDYTLYAIPTASVDSTFWFGVDRDDGGTFNETISSPVGDTLDSIEIIMSNLIQTPPNHYREMTLTLYCEGFNQGNIRWGLPGHPNMYCGQTVNTVFIYSANQQTLEIIAQDTNMQSYVNYTLVVAPKVPEPILKNMTPP